MALMVASDARQCFKHTHDLLGFVFLTKFQDGKLLVRSQVANYIKRKLAPPADSGSVAPTAPTDGSP